MGGLPPDKFFDKMRSELFKGEKILQRKEIVLTKQKLRGEVIVYQYKIKQIWCVIAYNSDFFLNVNWSAPTDKSTEIETLVLRILDTFEFNPKFTAP